MPAFLFYRSASNSNELFRLALIRATCLVNPVLAACNITCAFPAQGFERKSSRIKTLNRQHTLTSWQNAASARRDSFYAHLGARVAYRSTWRHVPDLLNHYLVAHLAGSTRRQRTIKSPLHITTITGNIVCRFRHQNRTGTDAIGQRCRATDRLR